MGERPPETPTGTIDGVNRVFHTSVPYIPGSLAVWHNGLLLVPDDDDGWTETDPGTGEFELKEAPLTFARLRVVFYDASAAYPEEQITELDGSLVVETSLSGSLDSDTDELSGELTDESKLSGCLEDGSELCGALVSEVLLYGTLDEDCTDMAEKSFAEVYRGEGRTFRLTIRDKYKQPQNLTDHELQMDVRDGDDESATLLFSKSIGSGIELETQSGDTLGQALITLDPADTTTSVPEGGGSYKFDVWARLPAGGPPLPVIIPSEFRILGRITSM